MILLSIILHNRPQRCSAAEQYLIPSSRLSGQGKGLLQGFMSQRVGASESAQFDAAEEERLFHALEMYFCAFSVARYDFLNTLSVEQQAAAYLEEGWGGQFLFPLAHAFS